MTPPPHRASFALLAVVLGACAPPPPAAPPPPTSTRAPYRPASDVESPPLPELGRLPNPVDSANARPSWDERVAAETADAPSYAPFLPELGAPRMGQAVPEVNVGPLDRAFLVCDASGLDGSWSSVPGHVFRVSRGDGRSFARTTAPLLPRFSLPLWSLDVGERLRVVAHHDKGERVSEGTYDGRLPLRLSGDFSVVCRGVPEAEVRTGVSTDLRNAEAKLLSLETVADGKPLVLVTRFESPPITMAKYHTARIAARIGWAHPVTASLVRRIGRQLERVEAQRPETFRAAYAQARTSSVHDGLRVSLTRVRCSANEPWPNPDALDVLLSTVFTLGLGAQLKVPGCGFELSVTNTRRTPADAAPLLTHVYVATAEQTVSMRRLGSTPTTLAAGATRAFVFFAEVAPKPLDGKPMLVLQDTSTANVESERVLVQLR